MEGEKYILGVLITLAACYSCNVEILGVLNTIFFIISRNVGGAAAPQVPPALLCAVFAIFEF